jgi:hypothetical protein
MRENTQRGAKRNVYQKTENRHGGQSGPEEMLPQLEHTRRLGQHSPEYQKGCRSSRLLEVGCYLYDQVSADRCRGCIEEYVSKAEEEESKLKSTTKKPNTGSAKFKSKASTANRPESPNTVIWDGEDR